MLAIPLDEKKSTTMSKLYGNAPYFGLYDGTKLSVIENKVKGKGPASAEFLKNNGATSTVFYHMGEGVYKAFVKQNMDVYSSQHTEYLISQAYEMLEANTLIKLDESNYEKLLDPGSAGECKCGCEA
jgi:predicted Fe-Mo cluster-binding NifX family protein